MVRGRDYGFAPTVESFAGLDTFQASRGPPPVDDVAPEEEGYSSLEL